jgi:hypothetical protein
LTVTVLFLRGAPSDERTGPSFVYAVGPRQVAFLGSESVGLATIFYCFRFDTSLFVASYDSQGYGGGIQPRLYTGIIVLIKVKVTLRLTVSQSVSLGVEPYLGLMTRYLLFFDSCGLVFVGHTR